MMNKDGFTLIEILIAITIVAIMATAVGLLMNRYIQRARVTSAQSSLQSLQTAIETFNSEIGQYPTNLEDLIQRPRDPKLAKRWTDRYLKKEELPLDPWNNDFQYKLTPGGPHPYELYSEGRDADEQTRISVWDL